MKLDNTSQLHVASASQIGLPGTRNRLWILVSCTIHSVIIAAALIGCSVTTTSIPLNTATLTEATALPSASVPNETPTLTQALTANIVPSVTPTFPPCPSGFIMFKTGAGEALLTQAFVACADGSFRTEITPSPLAFVDNASPKHDFRVWIADDGNSLYLTDISGEHTGKSLASSDTGEISSPTWSPDGNYIAFLRREPSTNTSPPVNRLDIVHVGTGAISSGLAPSGTTDNLVDDQGWQWIEWSPATYQILLYGGVKPLSIADIKCDETAHKCNASMRPIEVKGAKGKPHNAWSPDGTRIAYACYTTASDGTLLYEGLCIQDSVGHLEKEFREQDLGLLDIEFLAWSPNGRMLALTAKPAQPDNAKADVFVLSVDSGKLVNVTSDPTTAKSEPIWIP